MNQVRCKVKEYTKDINHAIENKDYLIAQQVVAELDDFLTKIKMGTIRYCDDCQRWEE